MVEVSQSVSEFDCVIDTVMSTIRQSSKGSAVVAGRAQAHTLARTAAAEGLSSRK